MPTKKQQRLKISGVIYAVFWLLTGTWGLWDVNRAFDVRYGFGTESLTGKRVPTTRVTAVDIKSPYHQGAPPLPGPWRWRSTGLPIAPFLILDQAGAQLSDMGGIGGRRIVLWVFGWSKEFWIQTYWVS